MTEEEIIREIEDMPDETKLSIRDYIDDVLYKKGPRNEKRLNKLFLEYKRIMEECSGVNILDKNRLRETSFARSIIGYALIKEGFRYTRVGAKLGKDHSTIHAMVRKVEDVISMPKIYKDEYVLLQKFNERVKKR